MKKLVHLVSAVMLALTLFLTTGMAMAAELPKGSAGALGDDSYTLEEMLTYAIQDEYAAQAEYSGIIDTYGAVKPYKNIVTAETKHINALIPLFGASNLAVPVNDAKAQVVIPDSLKQSYEIGINAEIQNIEMYNRFLKENLPTEVRTVFESLMNASQSHLAAFERAAKR
nr:ferritin family protein [uncultured Acetobacterium sp.]